MSLAAGEAKTLSFEIGPRALQFWNADMQRVVEAGAFSILVGANSVDLKKAVLTVVD